jgi:predicted nucleic acid-binding protein
MNLDGIEGFLFAVEKLGKLVSDSPKHVDLGWLMSAATEYLGEQEAWDALRGEAERNPFVQVYLSAVEIFNVKTESNTDTKSTKSESYDQLKTRLPMKWTGSLGFWGKRASDDDLLQAAQGLRIATDVEMQRSHLAIFRKRRFPLDHNILIQLAGSSNEQIQWAALNALAQIADPAVRTLALDLVQTKARWRELAISLLGMNFQPGDHEIVLDWFEAEEDMETLHTESIGLVAFWKANPSEKLHDRMLLDLYEKCPCSFCREGAVSLLLERNALPEHLRKECRWDANEDIRELINADESESKLRQ